METAWCLVKGVTGSIVAIMEQIKNATGLDISAILKPGVEPLQNCKDNLSRILHESLAATTDMAVLPGVLGCRPLRRTVQVRLGTNTLRLPGGTPILVVSRQQFTKYPA